jgi:hypothetical protein
MYLPSTGAGEVVADEAGAPVGMRFPGVVLSKTSIFRGRPLPYPDVVTAAHDYTDLHELIERLEPDQADELRQHALRLVGASGRFKVLRTFDGPATDLGARAKQIVRAEISEADADR